MYLSVWVYSPPLKRAGHLQIILASRHNITKEKENQDQLIIYGKHQLRDALDFQPFFEDFIKKEMRYIILFRILSNS